MNRAVVARVQIHDVARRQGKKMQNFGGHIFQVASSDFKDQTDDLSSQDCGKLPLLTPHLGVSASVVLSLITETVRCV